MSAVLKNKKVLWTLIILIIVLIIGFIVFRNPSKPKAVLTISNAEKTAAIEYAKLPADTFLKTHNIQIATEKSIGLYTTQVLSSEKPGTLATTLTPTVDTKQIYKYSFPQKFSSSSRLGGKNFSLFYQPEEDLHALGMLSVNSDSFIIAHTSSGATLGLGDYAITCNFELQTCLALLSDNTSATIIPEVWEITNGTPTNPPTVSYEEINSVGACFNFLNKRICIKVF